ncbi:polysaccharide deacetylase family protein [Kurthia populi]|uniref:Polysaccharide deacetylase family protein n=2 Tax=Kurthia populi TaxID=1562132 RepID=A0ABW5Y4P5_9BACL
MKKLSYTLLSCMLLAGCAGEEAQPVTKAHEKITIATPSKKSVEPISQVKIPEKLIALTFNGLADDGKMDQLLTELKANNITATFFIPGIEVAERPDLVKRILADGHDVENNTLNFVMPEKLTYEEAYLEISLANKVMKDKLGIEPNLVRSRSGDSSSNFEQAAAELGMQVVTNNINPKDGDLQSAEEITKYAKRWAKSGSILELNTYLNDEVIRAIPMLKKMFAKQGYEMTTIKEAMKHVYLTDNYKTNNLDYAEDYKDVQPNIVKRFKTNGKKELAITFDDWSSEETLTKVLNILREHHVKATFFLIGNGVHTSPQLAKQIVDQGHEVANHSYAHDDSTTLTPKRLQESVIKTDKAISYAIQKPGNRMYRPPYGSIDNKSAQAITARGMDYIILYDVASFDWDMTRSSKKVLNTVLDKGQPGSILGMHILDDSHILTVLPTILETYEERGYQFRLVSDMLEDYDYYTNEGDDR